MLAVRLQLTQCSIFLFPSLILHTFLVSPVLLVSSCFGLPSQRAADVQKRDFAGKFCLLRIGASAVLEDLHHVSNLESLFGLLLGGHKDVQWHALEFRANPIWISIFL